MKRLILFSLLLLLLAVGLFAADENSPPTYGSVSKRSVGGGYIVMSGTTINPKPIGSDTTNVALSIYSPTFKTEGGMVGKGITALIAVGDSLNYSANNSAVETLGCVLQVSYDGKAFGDVATYPELIRSATNSSFAAYFSTENIWAPYFRIRYFASLDVAGRKPNEKRIYGKITTTIASPGK